MIIKVPYKICRYPIANLALCHQSGCLDGTELRIKRIQSNHTCEYDLL